MSAKGKGKGAPPAPPPLDNGPCTRKGGGFLAKAAERKQAQAELVRELVCERQANLLVYAIV